MSTIKDANRRMYPRTGSVAMKRILVPLDESDLAEQALSPAVAVAIRHRAEIHLLSVVSTVPPVRLSFAAETYLPGWLDQAKTTLRGYVEQTAAKVAARSEGLRVEAHVGEGRVGETIREAVEELDIDLVVLTTHGPGRLERAWLGSIADELVRSLERPILLLPPTENAFEENQIRHVMVPLDGSKAAEAVLDVLPVVLPSGGGVRLTLASVVEEGLPIHLGYLPDEIQEKSFPEERRKTAEAYLATVSRRLETEGIGLLETRVLTAYNAAHGLLDYCKENEVDVLALSTHGRGGVARFLIGSVADKLVRSAGIPVLITRRPSAPPETA